jgi:hypothetical protein
MNKHNKHHWKAQRHFAAKRAWRNQWDTPPSAPAGALSANMVRRGARVPLGWIAQL